LPNDIAAWVRERAKVDRRSLSFIIAELVQAEMAREAKKAKTAKPKPR
jgi:hypothetical protein